MPVVLMLVVILPLLALVIYNYTHIELKQVELYKNLEKAEYIAKSTLDAVINSWKQSNFDSKPSGELERIYYMTTGDFILESAWNNMSESFKSEYTVGFADVSVNRINDINDPAYGCTRFTVTASVADMIKNLSIVSSPYLPGHETVIPLYDYETGHFNYNSAPYSETQNVTRTFGGNSKNKVITVRFFDPHGILEMKTDNNEFYLSPNEFVGIGSNMITFHKAINLNRFNAEMGLILSSEIIIFRQHIHLRVGTSSYGTILIQVPDDMGISVSGKSGLYAKVYFVGGVTLHDYDLFGVSPKKSYIAPGEAYYVRKKSAGEEGFDLAEWMIDQGTDNNDFFRITTTYNNGDDILLPVVNDHLTFILEK